MHASHPDSFQCLLQSPMPRADDISRFGNSPPRVGKVAVKVENNVVGRSPFINATSAVFRHSLLGTTHFMPSIYSYP